MKPFKQFFRKKKRRVAAPSTGNTNLDNNTNPNNNSKFLNPPYGTEGRALTPKVGPF